MTLHQWSIFKQCCSCRWTVWL